MQTKKQSFIEICTSTAVGFVVSLTATFFIMPLFGFASTPIKNIGITIFYTVISILRGYIIRRFFNKKAQVKKLSNEQYYKELINTLNNSDARYKRLHEYYNEPIWETQPNNVVVDDLYDTCFVACESCENQIDIESSFTDADSNYFCPGCWEALKWIMDKEYKDLVAKGEIEE